MHIEHVCASSSSRMRVNKSAATAAVAVWVDDADSSILVLVEVDVVLDEALLSTMAALHSMHLRIRTLHSAQTTRCPHGPNTTEHGSSSHSLHLPCVAAWLERAS